MSTDIADTNELVASRMDSMRILTESLGTVFPIRSFTTTTISEEIKKLDVKKMKFVSEIDSSDEQVCLAGRIVLFRVIGKLIFLNLDFNGDELQAVLEKGSFNFIEQEDDRGFKSFTKHVDLGDWIEVRGVLCKTNKEEPSIFARNVRMMCKSLNPLPDKHKGLQNIETRYRKRWLDIISNKNSRNIFIARSTAINTIRDFMHAEGFMEVETPVLSSIYGGANARPFTSFVNATEEENFLRISLEIPLKKLLVAGFPAVFEIGKVFRNESIDSTHLPEYTSMEAYKSFADYIYMQDMASRMCNQICRALNNGADSFEIEHNGQTVTIDTSPAWETKTVAQAIQDVIGLDCNSSSTNDMIRALQNGNFAHLSHIDFDAQSKGDLMMLLFENFVEDTLVTPIHIIDYPIESTPLCKPLENQTIEGVTLVERFESYILGQEIANSYSELNDPVLQRQLFIDQQDDEEAQPLDEEFLDCLASGMPPAGGIGFGIDRLVSIFTQSASIKDVVLFPLMKSES